ncbi:hypothetical protein SLEP1_g596 [Rubroshorea leprosula]|uniref:Uncharacterized protein n=1 Tax=Rubroshorea leprosula TaxID=152421 RepID=A0AAV5HHQ9_9ROSI|nr:hypothetical protein SLEP1_g596 [Rubroshorea leprosula]
MRGFVDEIGVIPGEIRENPHELGVLKLKLPRIGRIRQHQRTVVVGLLPDLVQSGLEWI